MLQLQSRLKYLNHSLTFDLCICSRRMFPHCSISLSGLQPFANYVIMVDMVPVGSYKYKVNAYATHTVCTVALLWASHTTCLFSIKLFFPSTSWFSLFSTFCFACRGTKTNRLQYVKRRSLQPDTGLPTLGCPPLHIKAFHCFLFVHSRLEAQSISIPPYSQSVNEEQSATQTFNGSHINCCGPFGHRYRFLARTRKQWSRW